MNRREFCQTTAMFLAGSVCAGVALRSDERTTRFRAQKVFLESWDTEKYRQEELGIIAQSGCHAVLLIPGRHIATPMEIEKIMSEALRFSLRTLFPTCLNSDLLDKTKTFLPLSHEAGILQHFDGKPTDEGGFLLLDIAGELHGLVLYDSSQCRWTGFAIPRVDCIKSKDEEGSSRMMAARWLDQALFKSRNANQEP